MKRHIVGVDPGKIHDPTGIVVVSVDDHLDTTKWPDVVWPEYIDTGGGLPPPRSHVPPRTFVVTHVERRPLDESYPAMVRYTAGLLASPALASTGVPPEVVFDCTGVGQAVADLAREAGMKPRLVSITSGVRPHFERGYWRTPKADLIAAVVVKAQAGQLTVDPGATGAEALKRELLNFRVTTTATGRDSYGAGDEWRDDSHDDLVLALCCAVWWGDRPRPPTYGLDSFAKVRR